jgi:hypothetical protein
MRRRFTALVLALSVLNSGCTLVCDTVRTVYTCVEDHIEDALEYRRDRQLANEVWDNTCGGCPGQEHSGDYVRGFKDGFVDYLYRGGNCEPPAIPPHRYRKFRYQTPQGYQAIENWFAGYRAGATAAHETNYRRWITGPVPPCVAGGGCGGCGPAGCCPAIDPHLGAPAPYPVLSSKGEETLPALSVAAPKMGAPVPVDAVTNLPLTSRTAADSREKTGAAARMGIEFVPVDQ